MIIPFRDKFKIRRIMKSRPLLLHLMLKQGQTWYPLSNIREMMELKSNEPQSIDMHVDTLSNHEIMKKGLFILLLIIIIKYLYYF